MRALFHDRGDALAVRYKAHGQLRTQSWRELEPRARVEGHTLGLAWLEGLLADVLALDAPWRSGEVLWIEPALAERDPRVLGMWLASGAVLAVDETRDGDDRRELAPTIVIASAEYYRQLAEETGARLERNVRRLGRWAFANPRNAIARWAILRPLVDQLGLARARQLLAVELPDAATRAWFEALGLPLTPLQRAELRETVPALRIQEAQA